MSTFPQSPLDLRVELNLAGAWTNITPYLYQRDGEQAPVKISRGKPDEATQANPSTCSFELNNRDGRFSPRNPMSPYFGLLNQNTPVRVSVPAGVTTLRLEDAPDGSDGAAYVSCPSTAALSPSSALDLRVDLERTDWQEATVLSKWASGSDGSWSLYVASDGVPHLSYLSGGLYDAHNGVPLPSGRQVLRVTWTGNNGSGGHETHFYTGPSLTGSTWTELGTGKSVTPALTMQSTTAPVRLGYNAGFTSSVSGATPRGLTGRLYGAQLTINGTLAASPGFTSMTPGQASVTDAQGNTWTLGGGAVASDREYRFSGEMSSLPGKWDVTGNDVSVEVAAAGVLRRLGQGSAPVQGALKRAMLAGTLPGLQGYWPLEDGKDADRFGSAVGGQAGAWAGTGVTLASDTTFDCSQPLPTLGNAVAVFKPGKYALGSATTVRWLCKLGSTLPPAAGQSWGIAEIGMSGGPAGTVYVNAYNGGGLGFAGYNGDGTVVFNSGVFSFPEETGPMWMSLDVTQVSGGLQYALVVIAPGSTLGHSITQTISGATRGTVATVRLNPQRALTDTVYGHLTVQNAWNSLFQLGPAFAAYDGESAAVRFARVCGENGVTCRVTGIPGNSAAMGPQPIDTMLNILQECEDADRGMIYEPRQVAGLAYRTLGSIQAQAPDLTADYSASQPGGVSGDGGDSGFEPAYDDQYTRNDLTLSRGGGNVDGGTYQYQLDDGSAMSISPPPVGIGDYGDSDTVNVHSDGQLPDIAAWRVHLGTVNEVRWPGVPWNLARPQAQGIAQALRSLDTGDVVQISSLPAQQTYDPVRQVVSGLQETLGGFHWTISHNVVPASPYDVLVLDDPVRGLLNTDGSQLATAAVAGTAPVTWGTAAAWAAWSGTSATVTPSGGALTITSTGPTGGFWQGFGPSSPVAAGQTVALVAVITAAQALGAVSVGVHLAGGSDTFTKSAPIAVAAGQTVTVCVTATAAAGQTSWSPYVVDAENSPAGYAMTAQLVYGGVATALSVALTGTVLWDYNNTAVPYDIAVGGERMTVTRVAGTASPQTLTVVRSVNGVTKSHSAGESLSLWQPNYLALGA